MSCGESLANLIETKFAGSHPRNLITHEKSEVSWLRTLTLAVRQAILL